MWNLTLIFESISILQLTLMFLFLFPIFQSFCDHLFPHLLDLNLKIFWILFFGKSLLKKLYKIWYDP